MRNTYAVPESLIVAANQLARALGQSAADEGTFLAARYTKNGTLYAVASGQFDLSGPLVEPPWGADMALAAQAQAEIGHAILHSAKEDPQDALEELGLEPADDEPEE